MRKERGWMRLIAVMLLAAMLLQGCGSAEKEEAGETAQGTEESVENTESANQEAPEEEKGESDTVRWFNASYAILTEANGWDYNVFGGLEMSEDNQDGVKQLLDEWWGVTDRTSANENMDWILSEGLRTGFADDMEYLESEGISEVAPEERADFIFNGWEVTQEQAESMAASYNVYEEKGAGAIDAWDYCRALNLASYYYMAGYYTKTEALDKSLEIAKEFQPKFSSWDEMVDSYLYGYEYWAEESGDERRAIYEDLLTREDNPYAVDYNTELVKTW